MSRGIIKKLSVITLILLMPLAIVACSEKSKDESKPTESVSVNLSDEKVPDTKVVDDNNSDEDKDVADESATSNPESDDTDDSTSSDDGEVTVEAFIGRYTDAGENEVIISQSGAEVCFVGLADFANGMARVDGERLILTFDGANNPCHAVFSFYYTDLGCTLEILEMSFEYLSEGEVYEGFVIQE